MLSTSEIDKDIKNQKRRRQIFGGMEQWKYSFLLDEEMFMSLAVDFRMSCPEFYQLD